MTEYVLHIFATYPQANSGIESFIQSCRDNKTDYYHDEHRKRVCIYIQQSGFEGTVKEVVHMFDKLDNNKLEHPFRITDQEYRDVWRFAGMNFSEVNYHCPVSEEDRNYLNTRIRPSND